MWDDPGNESTDASWAETAVREAAKAVTTRRSFIFLLDLDLGLNWWFFV